MVVFSSVQSLSCVWLFATPWTTANQASLSITNSRSLLKRMAIESMMPSNYLILCLPLLLLPSNLSQHQSLFKWVSSLHKVAKVVEFQLQNQSFQWTPRTVLSNEHSFRMDWLDLLAAQWTLKHFLQRQSSKASILRCSAFFIVQHSHLYMTTAKTIALTRWTFVGKVIFLLLSMLSRLVIAFLPRSKRLLISWLQVTICSDFGAQENNLSLFPLFPHLFPMKWWDQMPWS